MAEAGGGTTCSPRGGEGDLVTNLITNRGAWMIAALALAGGCVDGDEPIERGEPSGAAHARQLEQAAGLDEAEILEMLDEHAGKQGEPVVLSGDAAVAFQGAQAELAAAAGDVRILCSAYSLPLPVPWVGHTKMTSCIHSDYWASMNLESPAILSNLYDLASVTAIDTDLDLAGFPRIVAVPAAKTMSLAYRPAGVAGGAGGCGGGDGDGERAVRRG
jgi:hypothetical protein